MVSGGHVAIIFQLRQIHIKIKKNILKNCKILLEFTIRKYYNNTIGGDFLGGTNFIYSEEKIHGRIHRGIHPDSQGYAEGY